MRQERCSNSVKKHPLVCNICQHLITAQIPAPVSSISPLPQINEAEGKKR